MEDPQPLADPQESADEAIPPLRLSIIAVYPILLLGWSLEYD